jgi:hypothetical protein
MSQPQPTDEELIANPELALRGMSDEDFAKIGSLSVFLQDVIADARTRLGARAGDNQQKINPPSPDKK